MRDIIKSMKFVDLAALNEGAHHVYSYLAANEIAQRHLSRRDLAILVRYYDLSIRVIGPEHIVLGVFAHPPLLAMTAPTPRG